MLQDHHAHHCQTKAGLLAGETGAEKEVAPLSPDQHERSEGSRECMEPQVRHVTTAAGVERSVQQTFHCNKDEVSKTCY